MIDKFTAVWEKYILGNKEDFTIGLSQLESEIRADAIREFAEWLESNDYLLETDYEYGERIIKFHTAESIIDEYEKRNGND